MSIIQGPLISCQRYLDKCKVIDKATRFKNFIVTVYPIILRGVQYTVVIDGHHNLAAAKMVGIEPDYRPAGKKFLRIVNILSEREREAHFINNLTDCDYYYVETGEVVEALLMPDTSCKFAAHAGNPWIFGVSNDSTQQTGTDSKNQKTDRKL